MSTAQFLVSFHLSSFVQFNPIENLINWVASVINIDLHWTNIIFLSTTFIVSSMCLVINSGVSSFIPGYKQILSATAHEGPWLTSTYVLRYRGVQSCGQYRGWLVVSPSRYSRSLQPGFATYLSFPNSSWCWVDSCPIHWPKFPEKISSPRETRTSARPVVRSQSMMP